MASKLPHRGLYTCADEGTYPISILVNDVGGSSTSISGTAQVNDAPLTAGMASATKGTEGVTSSTLTATFNDANAGASAGDFSGTINWGDNNVTAFTSVAVSGAAAISRSAAAINMPKRVPTR